MDNINIDRHETSPIRHFMLRLGRTKLNVLISLVSLVISVLVTVVVMDSLELDETAWNIGLKVSVIIPLIVAPICGYFGFGLLFRLDKAEKQMRRLACLDELTGISNRRFFYENANTELLQAARYKYPVTILLVDADHFKRVNDEHGHQAGDDVLKSLGNILSETVRESDLVGRYGGEEFVCLMTHTTASESRPVAQRLLQQLRSGPFVTRVGDIHMTLSIGIADTIDVGSYDIDTLIASADQALYRAKAQGRDRMVFHTLEEASSS